MLESLSKEVIEGLHAAHKGVGGMLAKAQDTVFMPGIYGASQMFTTLKRVPVLSSQENGKLPHQG